MKVPSCFLLGLALFSAVLAGCSGPSIGGMSISIVGMKPTDPAQLGDHLTLTLRFINENVIAYGFSRAQHRLSLNGQYVGTATSTQALGIPPTEAATQDVTVKLENVAAVRDALATRATKPITYRLESVLFQTIDEDHYENKVVASGVLDLSGAATAKAP